MYCPNCGAELQSGASFCSYCGTKIADQSSSNQKAYQKDQPDQDGQFTWQNSTQSQAGESDKSKLAAGLLGIFLGGLGIHNFYLGYTGKAVAQLILFFCCFCFVSCIWGFIEGIMILAGSIDRDAQGRKLKD